MDEFGEEMSEELGDVFSHVSTIVRTEAHSVSNGVRVEGYRQAEEEFGEEFRYDWKGPSDGRTTELCEEIKSRVPDEGLPLDELRELVNEVSDEYGFSELEFPTPHFNCRHQVVRVQ